VGADQLDDLRRDLHPVILGGMPTGLRQNLVLGLPLKRRRAPVHDLPARERLHRILLVRSDL